MANWQTRRNKHFKDMAKIITTEQNYAIIIMVASDMGINVEMLSEAEGIIKEKRHIEPCQCLCFEHAALAAHEGVRLQGLDAIKKANKKADIIKKQYIYNRL